MWAPAAWISLPSEMPCSLYTPHLWSIQIKVAIAPIGHRKVDDKRDCAAGADDFLPVLIYVVIHANPPQLASNLEYIQRFRMHSRMASESAYFFTQLVRPMHLPVVPHHAIVCVHSSHLTCAGMNGGSFALHGADGGPRSMPAHQWSGE